jgi:hypothetical protein
VTVNYFADCDTRFRGPVVVDGARLPLSSSIFSLLAATSATCSTGAVIIDSSPAEAVALLSCANAFPISSRKIIVTVYAFMLLKKIY